MRRAMVAAVLLMAACSGGTAAPPTTPPSTSPSTDPASSPPPTSPSPGPTPEVLAFIRDGDVWLVEADGSGERHLGMKDVGSFEWISPTELDVVSGSGALDHLMVDLDGTRHELLSPPGGSWSRDGSRYAVSVDQVVEVYDASGTKVSALEPGPGQKDCGAPPPDQDRLMVGRPAFSADGQQVLVPVSCWEDWGAYNFPGAIYQVSLDQTVNRPIDGFATNLRGPTDLRVAPDGQSMAQSVTDGSSICPSGTGVLVKRDDDDVRVVTDNLIEQVAEDNPDKSLFGGVRGYDWSPASDAVIVSLVLSFCDLSHGEFEVALAGLYVLPLDGPAQPPLVAAQTHTPAWSPSGGFVAYVTGDGLQTETGRIKVLDTATGKKASLGTGSDPAWQPAA